MNRQIDYERRRIITQNNANKYDQKVQEYLILRDQATNNEDKRKYDNLMDRFEKKRDDMHDRSQIITDLLIGVGNSRSPSDISDVLSNLRVRYFNSSWNERNPDQKKYLENLAHLAYGLQREVYGKDTNNNDMKKYDEVADFSTASMLDTSEQKGLFLLDFDEEFIVEALFVVSLIILLWVGWIAITVYYEKYCKKQGKP